VISRGSSRRAPKFSRNRSFCPFEPQRTVTKTMETRYVGYPYQVVGSYIFKYTLNTPFVQKQHAAGAARKWEQTPTGPWTDIPAASLLPDCIYFICQESRDDRAGRSETPHGTKASMGRMETWTLRPPNSSEYGEAFGWRERSGNGRYDGARKARRTSS
jgi:hypothetical protein